MSSWTGVAQAYERSFATLCGGTLERLLDDTRPVAVGGGHHLDVGSGTGDLAARAAEQGRTVVAVDADPGMAALTEGVVPGRAVRAALPSLPFGDGCFDAVTANFVVNHVGDPRAATRELARVTRPGGRVALTSWTARPPTWSALTTYAFEAAGVVVAPGGRLPPELDFDRSVEGLADVAGGAKGAGLTVLDARELRWDWAVTVDNLWSGIAGGVATAGQAYLAQTSAVRAAAEQHFRRAASELADGGLLHLPSTAAYVLCGA
ncbi:methyltransferase domain-containing protein [Terrabacter sp. NPDC000476]|uniref:class I SAM-dependent methyltransferase n=1 Tax=Terrabacter sp. NPDC000476 TaxID=3154258 RepID=UPI00331CF645